jgi:predicted RNase H-like nuclease
MPVICGADGCRGGWVAIYQDLDSGDLSWRLCATAHDLVYGEPIPQVIGLDIPIGLTDSGPRACDREARRLLGRPRASSVFPAPIRPVLAATSYAEACQIRLQVEGKKMSRQAWFITPKIREIDLVLRQDPALPARVREVHPEVSFYFLAGGQPQPHGKKSRIGREERRALLEPIFGPKVSAALAEHNRLASAEDDVLDAFAALWTAERILSGTCQTLPSSLPRDSLDLPMAILA